MRPRSIRFPRRKALDWIAAALAAAAVWVVPGVAIGISNGGIHGWGAFASVAALAAVLAAVAFHVHRRRVVVPPQETWWFLVFGGFLAWVVAFGGFILLWGAPLCGGGRLADTVAWVGLFVVYFVVATWALLGRYRPIWGLPLSVALSVVVYFGSLTLIPGGSGACTD